MVDQHQCPYPRGFIFSTNYVDKPKGFIAGPLLPNFYIHPLTKVDATSDIDGTFVVVLGTCVSTDPSSPNNGSVELLLKAAQKSDDTLLTLLDDYAGRYAVIWGRGVDIKVVSDATAMRSIFYAREKPIVASHALLVEQALGGEIHKSKMPFGYGFPGNHTPYSRTKILTPNTFLDLLTQKVRRFWPREALPKRTAKDVALETLLRASTALRRIADERHVWVSLTAGHDTRTLLALAEYSEIDFTTFTYGKGPSTRIDISLARDLAASRGLKHVVVPTAPPSNELKTVLSKTHYSTHHHNAIEPLMEYFADTRTVVLSANTLEIGQTTFRTLRRQGYEKPTTGETMATSHLRRSTTRNRKAVAHWGLEQYMRIATEAFSEFIAETQFSKIASYIDPFSAQYWEHRMSAWLGASNVERDFYSDALIPFNARSIFFAMNSVPTHVIENKTVKNELISLVDPKLLDFPINPKKWPLNG